MSSLFDHLPQEEETVLAAVSSSCVEVKSKIKGRYLSIGHVFTVPHQSATSDKALRAISGQKVFYRAQTQEMHFSHRLSKSVGCDEAAWQEAVRRGAQWFARYAIDTQTLFVAHASAMNRPMDLGQGKQRRAFWSQCMVLKNTTPLTPPVTTKIAQVEGI